jgi:hypothetical protein
MRRKLAKLPILKIFTSQKLTVICLLCLVMLTFWGTLYQTNYGLWAAQEKFFRSWIVWMGYLPFPGAKLVIWVMTINLICVCLFLFKFKFAKLGIWIMHLGLLSLLIGGGITHYFAVESQITLSEGAYTNSSQSLEYWELAVWTDSADTKRVTSIPDNMLASEPSILLPKQNTILSIQSYFRNSAAYASSPDNIKYMKITSASNIVEIEKRDMNDEIERNKPGLNATWIFENDTTFIKFFGGEVIPTELPCAQGTCKVLLRRKHYPLPFSVKLVDFVKDNYTNSDMAKSYESTVEIDDQGQKRNVKIFMNNPFRAHGYTLFQASFTQDADGETSTFSTVLNPGRLLPYISSIISGVGLAIHFILMSWLKRRKKI